MIRDLAEETAFDDFSGSDRFLMKFRASSMLAIIGRQVGVMSNWFVQSDPMISAFEILQKKQLIRIRSAFDDFSASSMLAIIGRQVGVMSNWFVQSPNDTRSCRRNS